jgi:hypothetical protein
MRICIIIDSQIDYSHGSGALLIRYFAEYPKSNLLSICRRSTHDRPFCTTYVGEVKPPTLKNIIATFARGHIVLALNKLKNYIQAYKREPKIRQALQQFQPDLFLIITHSSKGFELADQIINFSPKTPTMYLLWDLLLDIPRWYPQEAEKIMQKVVQNASAIEVISETMIEDIAALSQGQPPQVKNFFGCTLPSTYKDQHPELNQGVQPILFGNIRLQRHSFHLIVNMLNKARLAAPGIKEAIWYCHPNALEYLGYSPTSLPSGIRYGGGGQYTGHALDQLLCTGDICLIPFNDEDDPKTHYARHSIPSRFSELCANGIPIFLIAGKNTATARYAIAKDCAMVSSPTNYEQLCQDFIDLASSSTQRRDLGQKARLLAEREFDINLVRADFFARLRKVVEQSADCL